MRKAPVESIALHRPGVVQMTSFESGIGWLSGVLNLEIAFTET